MIKQAIGTIVGGRSLSFEEAAGVMAEIMDGEATPAQIAAFATALRIRGETVDEICGLASVMRARMILVPASPPLVDTCGVGGDNAQTFNVSTAAAIVAAGAGLRVAKHGNRAVTSRSGSADVLAALGVEIDLDAEAVARCINEIGFGFMLAPRFHPAMKHASSPRREIGIRTVFNILGPLANPARSEYQVIGVPERALGEKLATALSRLGTKHALVVHGLDGLDEISPAGPSLVWEVKGSEVSAPYEISPGDFGFRAVAIAWVRGGTPEENARIIRSILGGERGPMRDMTVMNAAAALLVGEKVGGLAHGAEMAASVIDSGRALEKLECLARLSQKFAQAGRVERC